MGASGACCFHEGPLVAGAAGLRRPGLGFSAPSSFFKLQTHRHPPINSSSSLYSVPLRFHTISDQETEVALVNMSQNAYVRPVRPSSPTSGGLYSLPLELLKMILQVVDLEATQNFKQVNLCESRCGIMPHLSNLYCQGSPLDPRYPQLWCGVPLYCP